MPFPTDAEILDTFDHHNLDEEQVSRVLRVRIACKVAAQTMLENAPPSADRTHALRQLHESMMTANKSIALQRKG